MADATAIPNDYRDPYWSNLAATTEQKLGLPAGLLTSIVQNGEKSNADQVSSAGAQTPFQITPGTRKAALDQYGVDAYLSPQNAAEVSGMLLKDSLARNNNDVAAAIGEYHGGTDRSNWGPKTQAYIQRVLGNAPDSGAPSSTFDRLRAQQAAGAAPSIANVYAAYRDGKMSPDDAAAFEQEVQAGTIMLPRGAVLKAGAGAAPNANPDLAAPGASAAPAADSSATPVPPAMLAAYKSGQMSQQDRQDFESLVRSGQFALPQGADLGTPNVQHPDLLDRAKALPGAIAEAVTGSQRATPATDAAPDWASMPELNSFSMKSFKAGLGTMMTGPEETAQIIKSQFPGVQVSRDDKGNYLLQSSIDGKTYAIKPGFQVSDVPRAIGTVAAFTPAGRAATLPGMMAGGAATQAAIEGTQAATGGTFDPEQVAVAGALPAAVAGAGALARAAATPVRAVMSRILPGAAAETPAAAATEGALTDAAGAAPTPAATPEAPMATPQEADAGAGAGASQVAAPVAAPEAPAAPAAPSTPPPAAAPAQQAGDLDRQIAQFEQRYQELLPQTSGAAPAGAIREARNQLTALQQAPVDTSDAAVRAVAKQIQSVRGVSYKDALSQAKRQVADQASDYQSKIDRLQGIIEDNRTAARATQELHDLGSTLSQLRSQRASLPDPIAAPSAPAVAPAAAEAPAAPAPASPSVYADRASPAESAPADMTAPTPIPVAQAAAPRPVTPMSGEQLAATAKQAANGSSDARATLAQQAAPAPKVLAAAKRLGIEDYLQPDHVTTNQAYRELAQAVKSVPGSTARASELEGLGNVAQRADKLVDEIGGTSDYSTLSSDVKKQLQDTHDELFQKADGLYSQVRDAIPAKSDAPAPTVLAMIKQRADELQGMKNLSPAERMIFSKLSPKTVTTVEEVPGNPLMPGAQSASTRAAQSVRQPTYALLDDVRRDLTAAMYKNRGPFKDTDQALITRLQGALRQDQEAVAQQHGMGDTWNLAQQTAQTYKGLQNDLTSLFGKNLDGSIVGSLGLGVKRLAAGDVSSFVKLLKSIPEGMRPQVVASSLNTAFGKAAARGTISFPAYANWYEGLLRNRQAYTALMANLPQAARKQLSDLYRVSRSISLASRERIATGRLQVVAEQIKGADSLVEKLYHTARHSAAGAVAATAVGHIPIIGHGAAAAIASALTPAKPAAIKAVDELIASPEFTALAKSTGTGAQPEAVSRFAYSKEFTKFMRSLSASRDITNRERWVVDALEASHESQQKK